MPSNAPFITFAILSNTFDCATASDKLVTNLSIAEITDDMALPIAGKTAVNGENAFITEPMALPMVLPIFLNTLNTDLKVSLIFLAVESLTFNFSVKSLNLLESSTNFGPVIEGNTSFQASPIEPITFPKLLNVLLSPFITASLPPF